MPRPRKTNAERRQERDAAERRCWDEFFPKLEAVQGFVEAMKLLNEAPPPDATGRRYYSNLGWFLRTYSVPDGASHEENAQYLRLLERFDAEGAIMAGMRGKLEEAFRKAMSAKYEI
jgi:hypothetical protein